MSRHEVAFPWPSGSATGIGPMPGTDLAEALSLVLGEVPALPFLPDLPARGPGADPLGRAGAALVGLPIEMTPRGWRLAARPGGDLGRAAGLLESDLDALVIAGGYEGPLKIQILGPWTLAASLELSRSLEPALSDPGAVADLAASLAEGLAALPALITSRVPGARPLIQLDEPALPGVLAGSVPSASGLRAIRPVGDDEAAGVLRQVISAAGSPAFVHCDSPHNPFSIEKGSGVAAVSADLSRLGRAAEDQIGEAVEAGLGLFAGAVPVGAPASGGGLPAAGAAAAGRAGRGAGQAGRPADPARLAAQDVAELWRRLGFPAGEATAAVVITPGGGLAGVSPGRAREALARCREAARILPELIEEGAR